MMNKVDEVVKDMELRSLQEDRGFVKPDSRGKLEVIKTATRYCVVEDEEHNRFLMAQPSDGSHTCGLYKVEVTIPNLGPITLYTLAESCEGAIDQATYSLRIAKVVSTRIPLVLRGWSDERF
jgi:hypothetical protein